MTLLERASRYWVATIAGRRDNELFRQGMAVLWNWVEGALFVRLFTDGEGRYANCFWKLELVWLTGKRGSQAYTHRKVWRQGTEVASKVKRRQGQRRVRRCKPELPTWPYQLNRRFMPTTARPIMRVSVAAVAPIDDGRTTTPNIRWG